MVKPKFVLPADDRRAAILRSVDLESDAPLVIAVEEMVRQAEREVPTHPSWYPLGARNAEGIRALRQSLESTSKWSRWEHRKLEGVRHLETGRFIAVHNCCERTGLDLSGKLPRFAATRKRIATKSLRDDLQGDLALFEDDEGPAIAASPPDDDLTLHLCAFIDFEVKETGERIVRVRAELIIGATCSDLGFTSANYRLPIDLSGLDGGECASGTPASPMEGGAIEADISIRKRQ